MKHMLSLFALFSLTGCSLHHTSHTACTPGSPNSGDCAHLSESAPNTPQALLIADNQQARTLANPLFERSLLSELIIGTAHRKAALDEFDMDLIQALPPLNTDPDSPQPSVILHAGDLINNSCKGEFVYAQQKMDEMAIPWYMAPGNHDGYYLGISSPKHWDLAAINLSNMDTTLENAAWGGENKPGGVLGVLDERIGWLDTCTPVAYRSQMSLEDVTNKPQETYDNQESRQQARESARLASGSNHYDGPLDKYGFVQMYAKAKGLVDVCLQTPAACQLQRFQNKPDGPPVFCYFNPELNDTHKELLAACWTAICDDHPFEYMRYMQHDPYTCYEPDIENCPVSARYTDKFYAEKPWQHFIIQFVRAPQDTHNKATDILIIDTASYRPDNNAALTSDGHFKLIGEGTASNAALTRLQELAIRRMLDVLKQEQGIQGFDLIMGHHPINDLNHESILRLREIYADNETHQPYKLYLSGDTHDGFDVKHEELWPDQKTLDIHESNLGATIDAPLEYALLSKPKDKEPVLIKRYFITPPTTEPWPSQSDGNELKSVGAIRSGGPATAYQKNYGSQDKHWQTCLKDFPLASRDTPPSDPLGLSKQIGAPFQFIIRQPKDYAFGLLYLFNAGEFKNIRTSSLFAYKINRMQELANVYFQLYKKYDVPKSDALEKMEWTVLEELQKLGPGGYDRNNDYIAGLGINAYSGEHVHRKFRVNALHLSRLIEAYREELANHEKQTPTTATQLTGITRFKQCAALFEAEREYR